ncbi:MAG: alpha/beta fold hydrolase [Rhodocyclaceae bacterium]|nr:alpha/beta fold hydrolase [Rhodocyclaceae bacterium]
MTTWILLRGLARDSHHWGSFAGDFARAVGEAVVTVDLAGNGARHRETSPTTIAGMLADCRADLAGRNPTYPLRLLALSLGGMIATEWMLRHRQEVASAVLIGTSMRPLARWHQRIRPQALPALGRLLLHAPAAPCVEREILDLTSRLRRHDAALLDDWIAWRERHPVTRANALRQLLAAQRFHLRRRSPAAPVLVLAGGQDELVDPCCSARIAEAWQCAVAIHPTAGHDLPLDDPQWTIERIVAWHGSHPVPAPS